MVFTIKGRSHHTALAIRKELLLGFSIIKGLCHNYIFFFNFGATKAGSTNV
jgi:hypothetical protein